MPAALKATSSSASTAWGRRFTSSCSPITPRRPVGSMLPSAATAIFSLIWCGACWRMARTHLSSQWPPIPRCRSSPFSKAGFAAWSTSAIDARSGILERASDLLEARRGRLIALLQAEGGKTLDDALAELRESVDFCRYYALEARRTLAPRALPGPTGEANELRYRGRGVFVCISPWNFPLSIFLGQITAALVAGNAVVAKPAEQTPLVAAEAVRILHEAGVPASALHLLPGDGKVGAALVADRRVAGVVFTGSTGGGRGLHRALATQDGAIVPLIAGTGGINPMIVDATALPEQVTDDVITSAFRSAGQRCSALRLLCLQEDVAEPIIEMIARAARGLKLAEPPAPSPHI